MPAKLSVLLPDLDAERFEAYCADRGHKKSTLVARLIREHLDREGYASQPALFPAENRQAKKRAAKRGRRHRGAK